MEIGQQPMMQSQENKILNKSSTLIISVSLQELNIYLLSSTDNELKKSLNTQFSGKQQYDILLDNLKKSLLDFDIKNVLDVKLIVNNKLSVLVPDEIFNKKLSIEYLKFNSEIFSNDTSEVDDLSELNAKNIYVPYININNYLIDTFGSFEFYHYSSLFIKKVYKKIDCENCISFYASVRHNLLNLVIFKGRKLYYSNTFEYQTKEDLLYFLLFVMEQNKLVNNKTKIKLIGEKEDTNHHYTYLSKFVKNIEIKNSGYAIENIVI
jgi:hypothetical protein